MSMPELAPQQLTHFSTEHYDVTYDRAVLSQAEVSQSLEDLHRQLAALFGTAPKQRLPISLFISRERYKLATRGFLRLGTGGQSGEQLGSSNPITGETVVSTERGPSAARRTLLHEATHQFQFRMGSRLRAPGSATFIEGLAERFGASRFDGRRVAFGEYSSQINLDDAPLVARRDWDRDWHHDLRALACDPRQQHATSDRYHDAWGLVAFLMEREPERFRKWAAAMDGFADPAEAWDQTFGDAKGLADGYGAWLDAHQQRFYPVGVGWDAVGDQVVYDPNPPSWGTANAALFKRPTSRIDVRIRRADRKFEPGLVFGWTSLDEYYVLNVLSIGWVDVTHFADKSAGWPDTQWYHKVPEGHFDDFTLTVEVVGHHGDRDRVRVSVNGDSHGEYDCAAGGLMGLWGDAGKDAKDVFATPPDGRWPDVQQSFEVLRADEVPGATPPPKAIDPDAQRGHG